MENKQSPALKSIIELISRLCLQLLSAQCERFEQAKEVLQTSTHTPAETRQKVKLVLFLCQRIKANQELLKRLGHYVEVATADEAVSDVRNDVEDTVALDEATHTEDTDDSMDVNHTTTFIKEFGLGIDDVLAILSHGPAFWTDESAQSSDVVALEASQHCGDTMYWPVEWKEEDPSQLGWWIDVSQYDTRESNRAVVTTAQLDNDLNSESCTASTKGVSGDENDEVEVLTSEPIDVATISATNSSLSEDNISGTNAEQTEILRENLYESVMDTLGTGTTTWAQILGKNASQDVLSETRLESSGSLSYPVVSGAFETMKSSLDCVDLHEFQLAQKSCSRWRRKRAIFDMKAQRFLEGQMPLPTSNYFQVLLILSETAESDDSDEGRVEEDNADEEMVILSNKWRKRRHEFERKAHECIHEDESIPITNSYSVLAALVSDSSDDDEDQ